MHKRFVRTSALRSSRAFLGDRIVALVFVIQEVVKQQMFERNSRAEWFETCRFVLVLGLFSSFCVSLLPAQDQGGPPKVPSNWNVEQVAEFPEIKYPSVVEVAPDGRVFVGEDPMDMPGPVGEPIDRIVCFHPDGRKTVVAENFYAVFGLLFIDGKLYVNHPPKVTVLDVDGGKATDRKTLIESLGKDPWQFGFNDHIPSQLRLGMDGFIYMSVGDKGIHEAEGTDGSTATLQGGGIFRFRPDATDLEVYSSGTRNHLDIAVNSQDEMFTYDNTDDGNGWWTRVTHMVDGGFYGYPHDYKPRRPYTLWMMEDYGGGSPTGAVAYTGARLPKKYHEDLFMCEWGKQAVIRFEVFRDGATYQIDHRERFFSRKGDTFTPLGIEMGQDGTSFYVTDWNYSGWKKDLKRGQLFKMTYTGDTRDVAIPDWYEKAGKGDPVDVSTKRLINEGLKHPARRVRMVAQRRLADRGEPVIEPLRALLKNNDVPEHARWHGIWTLDAIDGGRSARDVIVELTKNPYPASVRRQAMRQLGTREAEQAVTHLTNNLTDDDASIRFWAATALGRISDPRAVPELLKALDQDDLFARYAAFHALNRIGRSSPEAWSDIAEGFHASNERIRSGTRYAMRETYRVENAKALAGVVRNGDAEAARVGALKTLAALLRKQKPWDGDWWGTQPIKKGPRPKTETWKGTDVVRDTIEDVLESGSNQLRRVAVETASNQNIPSMVPMLIDVYNRVDSEQLRTIALKGLTNTPDERAVDAYLDGLAHQSAEVRASSRNALRSIANLVREQVIRKAREQSLPDDVLQQLATVFAKPRPIRDWHLIGPFELDRSLPFDLKKVSLDETFDGKTGTVSWKKAKGGAEHGKIDLDKALGQTDRGAAMARTTIRVPEPTDTKLTLGSDDGIQVWVNGEKVYEDLSRGGWGPDQAQVSVSLKKGENDITCRITEHGGGWAFSVKYIARDFVSMVKQGDRQ